MQISILNVSKTSATTSTGKPYDILEVAFKNLTFQGKVESKKLMPFGANGNAFKAMEKAVQGEVYDVQVVKNDKGYNDWVAITQSTGGAETYQPAPNQQANGNVLRASSAPVAKTSSTYETPEERAKKQVYIVRQSSVSSAIAALSVGSKAPVKAEDAIEFARKLEAFVFGYNLEQAQDDSGFDNMDSDIPE